MAERFNEFFTTVASKLVEKLPAALGKFSGSFYKSYYGAKGVTPDSFKLTQVSVSDVHKLLKGVGRDKATGLDDIPARFIVDAAHIIDKPISHILNLSLSQGIVPDEMKAARVVPLHKKNSKTDTGNYRPVSILSCISKIL